MSGTGVWNSIGLAGSGDGSVVVGLRWDGATNYTLAYRWTAGSGSLDIGDLSGGNVFSIARGVSGDGSVIVGPSHSAAGQQAFRWTQATGMVAIGPPGSDAFAVSHDGSVIVGEMTASGGAAIWDSVNGFRLLSDVLTQELGLDIAGWTLGQAQGVSADGLTIVGWGYNPNGQTEAWVASLPEPRLLWWVIAAAVYVATAQKRPA
jgi:probable HAF family extracellular repeat protein